jgi:membrane-associated phospholipid phosphatase
VNLKRFVVVVFLFFLFVPNIVVQAQQSSVQCNTRFEQDNHRYGEQWFIPRVGNSLIGIPASPIGWDSHDWIRFSGFTLGTFNLMVPYYPERSLDVVIRNSVQYNRTETLDRIFPKIYSINLMYGVAGYTGLMAGIGWIGNQRGFQEYTSLMLETLAVTQFYHLSFKFILGRDSSYTTGSVGRLNWFEWPPHGTPSGHASTVYALLGTAAEYSDYWPVKLFAHLGGIYMGISLVYNNQHFISDVIWGALMGYYNAWWVNRFHSSKYRCSEDDTLNFSSSPRVIPFQVQQGGGIMLDIRF